MKKLTIDKYIHGELDESFNVPIAFISLLNTVLPKAALESLSANGFELQTIIANSKLNQPYYAEVEVQEKEVTKKIVMKML